MNGAELRVALDKLGVTQAEFSRLINVSQRAVSLWLAEERGVSGPAAAYLKLFESLPAATQAKELAKIREKDTTMLEGMYALRFRGQSGNGGGVLVLDRGRIYGTDFGALYDGTYAPSAKFPGCIDAQIQLSVPPGVALVTGVPPQPMAYGFEIDCTFAPKSTTPITVQTPFGAVEAEFAFLRNIPS